MVSQPHSTPMNVLGRTADGGAIVKVHGNDLGETARPGHHVVLKEVDSTLVDGALYLFATGRFRMYRRVYWTGPDTVKLEPEDGSEIGTIRLQWPEDKGEWEVLARVDKVLKPV